MTVRTVPTPCPTCRGAGRVVHLLPETTAARKLDPHTHGVGWWWVRCPDCRGRGGPSLTSDERRQERKVLRALFGPDA